MNLNRVTIGAVEKYKKQAISIMKKK